MVDRKKPIMLRGVCRKPRPATSAIDKCISCLKALKPRRYGRHWDKDWDKDGRFVKAGNGREKVRPVIMCRV
jgi:hypothetical protein